MRRIIRLVLTWFFVGVVATAALAVLTEWFIEVARDKGAYEDAGARWDRLVMAISDFVTSTSFLVPTSILGGVVLGLWIDNSLKAYERSRQVTFGPDSTFGRLRVQQTISIEYQQISIIHVHFTAHKHCKDLQIFADLRIRAPQTIPGTESKAKKLPDVESTAWQRVTTLSKSTMSAGEYISVPFIQRAKDEPHANMICVSEARQNDRVIPHGSVVACVLNVMVTVRKRKKIMQAHVLLSPPILSMNMWPEFAMHENLKETADFKA